MRRRDCIIFLGSAAVAPPVWTKIANAQKKPVIGVLWHAGNEQEEGLYFERLMQTFSSLGYVDGKTARFEHRYVAEQYDRFPGQVEELIKIGADLLIASIKPAAVAAKQKTSTVPIVFVIVADPVESNLVASLSKPGGRLSNMSSELSAKRLQLTKEAIPKLSKVALFVNASDPVSSKRYIDENRIAADVLKIELLSIELRGPGDLDRAFADATKASAHAVVLIVDAMFFNERRQIGELAIKHQMPCMGANIDMADAGVLMAFGPNHALLFQKAATIAHKILTGESPGNIPVEQPTQFELRLNMKAAKAINNEFPSIITQRADRVVE